jgi:hypothetical protein
MRRFGTEYMSTREEESNACRRLGQVTCLFAKKKLTLDSREEWWTAALISEGAISFELEAG